MGLCGVLLPLNETSLIFCVQERFQFPSNQLVESNKESKLAPVGEKPDSLAEFPRLSTARLSKNNHTAFI